MTSKIKKCITARRLSLSLILLLAGLMYLSTLIPQNMDSTPDTIHAWRHNHNGLVWLVDAGNLHRIYSQPWFALLILLAATALAVSSYDQIAAARRKLHATTGGGEALTAAISEAELRSGARSHRYNCLNTGSSQELKFVRNPWGYFGNALLHIGMVLVAGASLYVALNGRQGALILVEGEQYDARQPWSSSEHGIMTSPLTLPAMVRLDRVDIRFDDRNQPAQVSSFITVTDDSGAVSRFTAMINNITHWRGVRVYHASQYGDAFALEFIDAKGDTHYEKIPLQQPLSPVKAGYGDFSLRWSPYALSAKYFADSEQKTMAGATPLLIMRLLEGEREIARTDLTPGSSGELGAYKVRVLGVQKWAKLIFVDISGMPVIFAGFAVIMMGGLIHYMTPPREIVAIKQPNGSYRVCWRAPSFRDFFVEERDRLATALNKEVS